MLGSRLTPWIFVVGLSACTPNSDRAPGNRPVDTTVAAGGSPAATTSSAAAAGATGGRGAGGSAGAAGSARDGSAGTSAADAAAEPPMEMHDEASTVPVPCRNDRATLAGR